MFVPLTKAPPAPTDATLTLLTGATLSIANVKSWPILAAATADVAFSFQVVPVPAVVCVATSDVVPPEAVSQRSTIVPGGVNEVAVSVP